MDTNMRTLGIQVRLRRLVRAQAEAAERLAAEPQNRELASAAVARLLAICAGVRQAWNLASPGVAAAWSTWEERRRLHALLALKGR